MCPRKKETISEWVNMTTSEECHQGIIGKHIAPTLWKTGCYSDMALEVVILTHSLIISFFLGHTV